MNNISLNAANKNNVTNKNSNNKIDNLAKKMLQLQ